jgi:hypothetical protein
VIAYKSQGKIRNGEYLNFWIFCFAHLISDVIGLTNRESSHPSFECRALKLAPEKIELRQDRVGTVAGPIRVKCGAASGIDCLAAPTKEDLHLHYTRRGTRYFADRSVGFAPLRT